MRLVVFLSSCLPAPYIVGKRVRGHLASDVLSHGGYCRRLLCIIISEGLDVLIRAKLLSDLALDMVAVSFKCSISFTHAHLFHNICYPHASLICNDSNDASADVLDLVVIMEQLYVSLEGQIGMFHSHVVISLGQSL